MLVPFAWNYGETSFYALRKDIADSLKKESISDKEKIESESIINNFFDSLDFFYDNAKLFSKIFTFKDKETPFSLYDAKLLFGQEIVENHLNKIEYKKEDRRKKEVQNKQIELSFLHKTLPFNSDKGQLFYKDVGKKVYKGVDTDKIIEFEYFSTFFSLLSEKVGANNINEYSFEYPSLNEIKKHPHKRLTIGPTFREIIDIMDKLFNEDEKLEGRYTKKQLHFIVSDFLDSAIDNGGVVPHISHYDGIRIYRKGENDHQRTIVKTLKKTDDLCKEKGIELSEEEKTSIVNIMFYANIGKEFIDQRALLEGNVLDEDKTVTL
jgi:hypothetical protein